MNTTAEGFQHLLRAAMRETHYTSETYQRYFEQTTYINHPFGDSTVEFTEWVGSIGHTASIGAFLWYIARCLNTGDGIDKLAFHFFRQRGTSGHTIVAEFVCPYGAYLVGGINDYSGEGRSGYTEVRQVFDFLSVMYNVNVEAVFHPAGAWESIEHQIADEIYQQSLEQ